MPCRDPYYDEHDSRDEIQKIHKLTDMLCKLCGTVEKYVEIDILGRKDLKDIRIWWEKHQEADAARLAAEEACMQQYQVKLAAWNKLTAAERVALGVKKPVKGE